MFLSWLKIYLRTGESFNDFSFSEYKTKFNVVDDEVEDTVAYDMKNTFIFRPDLSNKLSGDEIISVPHPLIMSLIAVQREKQPFLSLVEKGIDILFHPETPFLTASVMDILFNGIDLDCEHEEFAAKVLYFFFKF
jgi:scavenger receptor class B protein 1